MKKINLLLSAMLLCTVGVLAQKTKTINAGDITTNTTWYSDTLYTIQGYVYVKNNATLTIQPGTIIKGDKNSKATLIITRNGKINANGTSTQPIVFTSAQNAGSRQPGDWGGIVILGKARINRPTDCSTCPGSSVAAGGTAIQNAIEGDLDNASGDGLYGGTDDNHNSGTLRYVRLEYGWVVITRGNEINGLTMGAVGKATQLDHIQVTQANDDGFEWFGGNVDAKYLISNRNIDDDLDVDFGFTGKIQFAVVLRDSNWYDIGSGPTTNGFESDNDGSGTEATPYTDPTFSNITVVGPLANGKNLTTSNSFQNGARIRRNSSTSIFNSIFMGWPSALFVDGTRTGQKFTNDSMMYKNNVLAGNLNTVNASSANASAVRTKIMTNGCDTPTTAAGVLNAPFDYNNPDFTTANSSVAASGASFSGSRISDAFFTPTTYRGAMGTDDWTKCWCNFNPQNTNYNNGPINNGFAYNAGNDTTICSGKTVTIGQSLTGAYKYSWAPSTGLSAANVARPVASPATSVTYVVTVTDTVTGCSIMDSVRFTVNPTPVANFTSSNGANGLVTFTNTSTGATVYSWTFGDGNNSNSSSATVTNTYTANGVFNVKLTATAGACSSNITKPVNVTGIAAPIKSVVGDILANTTWSKDTIYILNGYVYVKNNATLTIEAGTLIKGDANNKGSLIITRNGKINANGTRNMPIVFTSNKAAGSRQPGDWGGIIILGKAKINRPTDCSTCPGSTVAAGEAGIQNAVEGDLDNASGDGLYGGTDDNHNSGTFRYVRLEYGGVVITPGNEINGLTMGGVGKATQIDHIQVSQANDDGFEWFGGNVDAKYLISNRNIDDDLDVDFGFTGKVQFAVVLRDSNWYDIGSGPTTNGFESDNDGSGTEASPYTDPTFSNITVVGPLANGKNLTTSNSFQNGARIRRNSSTSIFNSIFMGWPSALFVDGTRTGQKFTNDSMMFKNNVLAGNLNAVNSSSANASAVRTKIMTNGCDTAVSAAGVLGSPFNYTEPDFKPVNSSVALTGASFTGTRINDPFFSTTTYRGAFGANDNWSDCWSNFNPQATDYSSAPVKYNPAVANFNYTQTTNTLSVQFNNNTVGGKMYMWDFGVSSSTTDTSTAMNPTFTFPVAGTYVVTLTAKAPCGDSTVTLQVMVQPSSTNEILKANSVKLYPNPTKGIATLAFELNKEEEVAISIFDISGREVISLGKQLMNSGSNTINIDASALTPGVYFTNISSDKFNKTYRLVIVK